MSARQGLCLLGFFQDAAGAPARSWGTPGCRGSARDPQSGHTSGAGATAGTARAKAKASHPTGQTENWEHEQMKRERAAAKSQLEQPPSSRTESQGTQPCHLPKATVTAPQGGGDQRAAEKCRAPSCEEHTLLSAQVEQQRAPAEPLITTASLGNEFRPPIPAWNVRTQGTGAKGSVDLHHRNHHSRSFFVCLTPTRLSQGLAPGIRGDPQQAGAALGSPAQHSHEFWGQKAQRST